MATSTVATITYAGSILPGMITSSPWTAVGCVFPGRGGIPTSPQFSGETLQPMNVDGARYRISGSHFPPFKMVTVVAAEDYWTANVWAREMELCRGDYITVDFNGFSSSVFVIDCRAIPSAKSVLGNVSIGSFGVTPTSASIDTEWDLQVVSA